jgi:hypothetical protein
MWYNPANTIPDQQENNNNTSPTMTPQLMGCFGGTWPRQRGNNRNFQLPLRYQEYQEDSTVHELYRLVVALFELSDDTGVLLAGVEVRQQTTGSAP